MEYAIWGIPQGQSEETLLVAMPNGKPITDLATAKRYAKAVTDKYGASKVRIQSLDLTVKPDFAATIN